MQIRLTGDPELPVGVRVSGCLHVSPLMGVHCVLLKLLSPLTSLNNKQPINSTVVFFLNAS